MLTLGALVSRSHLFTFLHLALPFIMFTRFNMALRVRLFTRVVLVSQSILPTLVLLISSLRLFTRAELVSIYKLFTLGFLVSHPFLLTLHALVSLLGLFIFTLFKLVIEYLQDQRLLHHLFHALFLAVREVHPCGIYTSSQYC